MLKGEKIRAWFKKKNAQKKVENRRPLQGRRGDPNRGTVVSEESKNQTRFAGKIRD